MAPNSPARYRGSNPHCQCDSPEGWGVVGNDDQLCLAVAQGLQSLLVAKHIFPTLHHQGKARVDALNGLLL